MQCDQLCGYSAPATVPLTCDSCHPFHHCYRHYVCGYPHTASLMAAILFLAPAEPLEAIVSSPAPGLKFFSFCLCCPPPVFLLTLHASGRLLRQHDYYMRRQHHCHFPYRVHPVVFFSTIDTDLRLSLYIDLFLFAWTCYSAMNILVCSVPDLCPTPADTSSVPVPISMTS